MSRKPIARPPSDCGTPTSRFRTLEAIVADYRDRYAGHRDDQHNWYRQAGDLTAAVRRAGLAERSDGSVEPHQRRLGRALLRKWSSRLQSNAPRIAACRRFDDLIRTLASVRIDGIGRLAIYDTAVRVGAYMGIEPQVVYVHAGAARGARAIGVPIVNGVIQRSALPPELQSLTCDQIEDCLCIYKDELARFNPAMRRSTSPSPPRNRPCN